MVSTRRKQTTRDYKVGDKVEVVRAHGIEVGTLVAKKEGKTSPRSSPVNHWVVSLDHSYNSSTTTTTTSSSSEDISERMLGRVLSDSSLMLAVTDSSESSTMGPPASTVPTTATTTTTMNAKGTKALKKSGKKLVSARSAAKGSRKATRRNNNNSKHPSPRSRTRSAGDMEHAALPAKATVANKKKQQQVVTDKGIYTTRNGLAVCKVPMNTGILFIYQDASRRVEFVRTK